MMNQKIPKYKQIAQEIENRIQIGHYKPGDKIPTIRHLAQTNGCNKITVQKAFELLHRQGIIENRVGSGSFVRFPNQYHAPTGRFDFRTDYLDESLFPHQRVQSIIQELFNVLQAGALSPAPVAGDPMLLEVLKKQYQLDSGGMLIISGAQQGLDLVAKVFSTRISDAILFEDPTYPGAIRLFQARHFVSLETDGPDIESMDRVLGGAIKLFYAMPRVHNPTGMAYSLEKMKAVAKRAVQYDFFIIEDDYLGELKPEAVRFVDLCPERTIFIKSFAQTTLAGIRLGLMVVPQSLYDQFLQAKFSSDISSFGLLQRVWYEFLINGEYIEHLNMVRRIASDRRADVQHILEGFPHLFIEPGQAGYSLWVRSRQKVPQHHIPWEKGMSFSFSTQYQQYFKISFMNMPDALFRSGLTYLRETLNI